MGYNCRAFVVVGFKTRLKGLYKKTDVRGCKHKAEDGARFCSECGAATWVYETKPIEGFDPDKEIFLGAGVFHYGSCEDDFVVVGKRVSRDVTMGGSCIEPIVAEEIHVAESDARKLDGKCPGEFGTWLCFYESF